MAVRGMAAKAGVCGLVLWVTLLLAGPLAAQDAVNGEAPDYGYGEPAYGPPPPPQSGVAGPPSGGTEAPPLNPLPPEPEQIEAMCDRAASLQQTCLKVQNRIIDLQNKLVEQLKAQGDLEGKAPLQELKTLHRQLRFLRRMGLKLRQRIARAGKLPPGWKKMMEKQENAFRERQGEVKDGLTALRDKLGPDPSEFIKDVDAGEDDGSALEGKLPEQMDEAAKRLMEGDVEQPRNLFDVFMRIPENETPKGNLNYYKEQLKRKK